ncbi:MAG: hypothetical protein J6A59_01415 [Lachnospiraceae bacterium]|nr:hypothetical protein [Lachnospiraceae bacterium]
MSIGLIKETIALRKESLQQDKEYTNELLVDDIIAYLGYNKRLDAGVKRRVSDNIDWEISYPEDDIKMMVKVYSYGYVPDQDEIDAIANIGRYNKYKICLITDGENIIILRPYNKLYGSIKINLFNDNEKTKSILEALSKNSNDSSVIDYYYYKELMTAEVVEKTIEDNKDNIAKDVLEELGCPVNDEFMGTVIQAISKVYDKNVQNVTLELQKKISDTELELTAARDSIEVLTGKLEIVQGELQTRQSEIESKQNELDLKQEELDNKNQELETKQSEIEEKQRELSDYENSIKELKENNSKLQSDLELEQANSAELKEKLDLIIAENDKDADKSDVDTPNDEMIELESQLQAIKTEKDAVLDEKNSIIAERDALKIEANELREETVRLNQVIDGLRASSASITLSKEPIKVVQPIQNIALVDDNIQNIASEIVNKLKTNSGNTSIEMDDELRKLQDYIYNLELSLNNSKRMIDEITSEKEALLQEKASLQRALDENTVKLNDTNRKYEDALKEITELRDSNSDLTEQNKDLSKFLEQSRQRNEELLANGGAVNDTSEGTDAIMANYRIQIEDLSTKLAIAKEESETYKEQYEALKQQMDELSSNKFKRVEELLACISDSDELKRTYVGVINEELYQTDDLNKFTGMSLQKLYEIKMFEASNYIFNGDIFSLSPNGPRRDLIINSKPYDIDIADASEDEVLNKLRVIFSKFSDIPFGCKKIGNLGVTDDTIVEESILDDEEELNYGDNDYSDYPSDEYSDENYDDNNDGYKYSQESDCYDESAYNQEEYYDGQEDYQGDSLLYVSQFGSLEQLTSRPDLRITAVRYLVSSNKTFIVAREFEEITLERMLVKSIDALLAVANSVGYLDINKYFKEMDLTMIHNAFVLSEEASQNAIRVFGGKYSIEAVESVYDIIIILESIVNSLNLELGDVWIYLDGETESDDLIDNYGAYENTIAVYENSVYEESDTYTKGYTIIPGYLPDSIPMTKNSMIAHHDILKRVVAVKSEKISIAVRSDSDYIKVFKALFDKANESGADINLDNIGYIINDTRKIVYNNSDEIEGTFKEFESDDLTYYVPDMEVYQYIYSLIKVQAGLFMNKKIAVKAEIDLDALEFYNTSFESCEPSLTLAISEFVNFIIDKDKN